MLEWIISSAALTAIVIVLRLLLKGKMSLRLQYALWALVLLRLLVPVSFGGTEISVQNVVDRPAMEALQEKYYSIPSSEEMMLRAGAQVIADPVASAERFPTLQELERYTHQELVEKYGEFTYTSDVIDMFNHQPEKSTFDADEFAAARTIRKLSDVLSIVWLSGGAAVALWFFITNLHFYGKLRRSRKPLELEDAPLPVYVTEKIDTPCLFGLIRPRIYVTPEVAEDEVALRYSIAHEATHRRHGDHIWAILRGLCLAVHWFDPLVWIAAVMSRSDAELACDEATIKRIGEEHRADYGRTLIQLTCQKRSAIFVAATTMTGSGRTIKERIRLIVKKPKTAIITLIAILLVIAIAVGCTFTGAKTDEDAELNASDLTEILDAIDLQHTTLVFDASGYNKYACDPNTAAHAERWLTELQQLSWEKTEAVEPNKNLEYCYAQLWSEHANMVIYGPARNCMVHVEADGKEGWFLPAKTGDGAEHYTVLFDLILPWYEEAEAAALFGYGGRLLSAEELDEYGEFAAERFEKTAAFTPRVGVENGSIVTLWGVLPPATLDARDPYYKATMGKNGDHWRLISFTQAESAIAADGRRTLSVLDLPAILDAIDLRYTTLTITSISRSRREEVTYPADAAICAEQYLEELKQYSWQPYPGNNPGEKLANAPYYRLATPRTTITFYKRSGNGPVHIETQGGEGWFLPTEPEGDAAWSSSVFFRIYLWYEEAESATLYDGEDRLMTAEELEYFRDYVATNLLLTSHFSDVRDMDAWQFLQYFDGEIFEPRNEAEEEISTRIKSGWGETVDPAEYSYSSVIRISRAEVDAYLMKYAGVTVEDMHTNWFEEVTYLPETDCFYVLRSSYFGARIWRPSVGVRNGSTVTLWSRGVILDAPREYWPFDRLTLEQHGDVWQVVSFTSGDIQIPNDDGAGISPRSAIGGLFGSGDVSLKLWLADNTEWKTYPLDESDQTRLLDLVDSFDWTPLHVFRFDGYELEAVSADGTKSVTFWQGSGTGAMIYYENGRAAGVWSASLPTGRYSAYRSFVWSVRSIYDSKEDSEALFSEQSFALDGTPEEVVEYFATTAFVAANNSLAADSTRRMDELEIIDWRVGQVSDDGTEVNGVLWYTYVARGPENIVPGDIEGSGENEGKIVGSLIFALEKQEDGKWHLTLAVK